MALFGCDTFVVLPNLCASSDIIFGKNSDRPNGEVQEVVFFPSQTHKPSEKLQCTYIEIDQVPSTHAVFLSKPAWMWGAEMGANNCGVVIGNEAVWTVVDDDNDTERLLGMDLLRLGLERASTSNEAVSVITTLLEKHGQGGPCSDSDAGLLYHNSFLIADQKESWVLETAGKLWAAERVTNGFRNISNCLSIGTNITKQSSQLLNYVKEQNLWKGEREINFKEAFSAGGCPREEAGRKLLYDLTADGKFDVKRMFQILRDKPSTICRPASDPFHTSASWVSVLNSKLPCHWVTATPDPSVSVFKPFTFSTSPIIPSEIVSPLYGKDPAKTKPRFQFKVDRRHALYKLHNRAMSNPSVSKKQKDFELKLLEETSQILKCVEERKGDTKTCNELFKNAVESEITMYSSLL
ncbi:secernin-2 [Homalodisca vitripennis]|uniref:secernin-2 n=1 Tax=Homalodisca vitripennis TaxID=197043 RepID=UPI001EE9CB62|nr:secernin-2 [Homalodisca vitripennis]KAG8322468.1 Secernin-2 [Homalodisca vitripennis]